MSETPAAPAVPSATPQRRWWVAALVVLALVAASVATVFVLADDSPAAASVRLEAADKGGADPFTETVALGPVVEFPGNVVAVNASVRTDLPADATTGTLAADGTTPGLYGGTGERQVCDPDKLVTYLAGNKTKAAAWAAVFGIAPADIGDYVAKLTPVVLTSDTLVTNHGFRDGRANAITSVLQSGTAVLVDATGVPRVKCNCGNPLTPPPKGSLRRLTVQGTPWPTFQTNDVVAVRPGAETGTLVLTDVTSGVPLTVPVGSGGSWVAAEVTDGGTTLFRSTDGAEWSEAGSVTGGKLWGLAWNGTVWVGVDPDISDDPDHVSSGTTVYSSPDLVTWNKVATVPASLNAIAWGDGRFIAVGSEHAPPCCTLGAAYTSTDAVTWTKIDARVGFQEGDEGLTSVSYGAGGWAALSQVHLGDTYLETVLTSSDGTKFVDSTRTNLAVDGFRGALAASPNEWLVSGEPWTGSLTPDAVPPTDRLEAPLKVGPSPADAVAVPGTPFDKTVADQLAWGPRGWLSMSAGPYEPFGSEERPPSATFYTSPDGRTWTQAAQRTGKLVAIAWGGKATAAATPTSAPPVTAAPTVAPTAPPSTAAAGIDLTTVDWKNHTYSLGACLEEGLEVALVDGEWIDTERSTGLSFVAAVYGDVTGDGRDDALVTITCYTIDGNAHPGELNFVFESTPGGPVQAGVPFFGGEAVINGGAIVTTDDVFADGDPRCCPSGRAQHTWRYLNGAWASS